MLSKQERTIISSTNNIIFVSAAVFWEIRIKQTLGKLELPLNFSKAVKEENFEYLPITVEHTELLKDLPLFHRDPFDRILICQALAEDLVLITRDKNIKKYDVKFLE